MERLARLALNDEGFLFDPQTGDSFVLGGVATQVFELLKQGESEEIVVSALQSNYGIAETEARSDVMDFIQQLRNFRLI